MTPRIITAPVGAKAQITLPKAVRDALHLKAQHDLIGFVLSAGRVALLRIEPVPSQDPFTEAEWAAIGRLAAQAPAQVCENAGASLRYLKRVLRPRG
jgi:bifunctional DNA-binding transcriptional regulator/antitoxin component of YhaV-PrlF toxin-antitoxin module